MTHNDVSSRPKSDKKPLAAASVGQFVEWYDFSIYGLSAVALGQVFFPSGNPAVALLSTFAVFAAGFLTRPLGAFVFGAMGDRVGRQRVLVITLILIGAATTCMGLLPTFDQIGVAATIFLVALRLLQGFSAGGESSGSLSFVYEHAPENKKATWTAVVASMAAWPTVAALLLVTTLSTVMPESMYMEWGWRVPFWLALPLTLVSLYIRTQTEETPEFKRMQREGTREARPMASAFRNQWRGMLQVFVMIALMSITYYLMVAYYVNYLQTELEFSRSAALASNLFAVAVLATGYIVCGRIADRVGKQRMLRLGAFLLILVPVPSFLLLTSGNFMLAILGQLAMAIATSIYGGGLYAWMVERFPASNRFSGVSVSYNLAYSLVGGTTPFVATLVIQVTGVDIAPAFPLVIFAAGVSAFLAFRAANARKGEALDAARAPKTGSRV